MSEYSARQFIHNVEAARRPHVQPLSEGTKMCLQGLAGAHNEKLREASTLSVIEPPPAESAPIAEEE